MWCIALCGPNVDRDLAAADLSPARVSLKKRRNSNRNKVVSLYGIPSRGPLVVGGGSLLSVAICTIVVGDTQPRPDKSIGGRLPVCAKARDGVRSVA